MNKWKDMSVEEKHEHFKRQLQTIKDAQTLLKEFEALTKSWIKKTAPAVNETE